DDMLTFRPHQVLNFGDIAVERALQPVLSIRFDARVLVLAAGTQSLALVDVDLGRPFGPASLQWLRNATRKDASFLILNATQHPFRTCNSGRLSCRQAGMGNCRF